MLCVVLFVVCCLLCVVVLLVVGCWVFVVGCCVWFVFRVLFVVRDWLLRVVFRLLFVA